ncbi:TetR family transcriptional regulator C-terminal domain-containing protein, partial [Nonomuraea fuscirosea]
RSINAWSSARVVIREPPRHRSRQRGRAWCAGPLPHASGDERTTRLAAELIVGATRDPALGAVLRDELRLVRAQVADRLGLLHPGWPAARREGAATLIVAAIDGLMLHRMVDADLPMDQALSAAEDLLGDDAP